MIEQVPQPVAMVRATKVSAVSLIFDVVRYLLDLLSRAIHQCDDRTIFAGEKITVRPQLVVFLQKCCAVLDAAFEPQLLGRAQLFAVSRLLGVIGLGGFGVLVVDRCPRVLQLGFGTAQRD
ncbi:hypothetical protein G6M86_07225 [Agrobacterium tumefaciens]|uniref:Uncharacterized protein n=1 Tax=Agrobacterium tumefaciens TaxID=358 RepID=A0AAJ4N0L2_AGRTU|nr:hypothetical protein G6M86_07225 [Agrobacterium tumefaciens]